MTRVVPLTPMLRGAGVYGSPEKSHVTACVNSRNPHGHNKACPCGWWARELAAEREVERREAVRVATLRRLTLEAREQDLKDFSQELSKKSRSRETVERGLELIGEQMRLNAEVAGGV